VDNHSENGDFGLDRYCRRAEICTMQKLEFWDSDFARKYAKVGTSCGTPFYPVWTGKSLSKLQEAGAQAVKGCQKICPHPPRGKFQSLSKTALQTAD